VIDPDVVAVSPDGKNVYVGAFFGANKSRPGPGARGGVVAFSRDPSTGALTQLPGSSGCIVVAAVTGCATGLALRNPEGLAVSNDGNTVYVAAPLSGAVDVFARDPATGALTQATNGTGCLSSIPQSGCGTARVTRAVDAVVVSPDDHNVYFGGGISASIPIFTRASGTGQLTQPAGTSGCVQNVLANGCALGRPLVDPEGVSISPDGANVYATMYLSSALDVFDRDRSTGALTQKAGGCFTSTAVRGCTRVRGGVRGVSSSVASPDGKYLYAVAALSNSLTVFRITR
jgi:DNA-binding beta-propeller fold protein YncE